jgi:hypothetical protein
VRSRALTDAKGPSDDAPRRHPPVRSAATVTVLSHCEVAAVRSVVCAIWSMATSDPFSTTEREPLASMLRFSLTSLKRQAGERCLSEEGNEPGY